jgi:3-phenylpropionate/trans-cinnamate dioxygenase ferredoxin subunit
MKAVEAQKRQARRHVVGPIDRFPTGTQRRVMVGVRAIAVFNVDGRFYALRDACPHQGAALSSGVIVSELSAGGPGDYRFDRGRKCVKCPWHGWEYDLETGRSYYDPEHDRVRAYAVEVESCGSYTAETVQVTTENAQVVLYL